MENVTIHNQKEIELNQRFGFGDNWKKFLSLINDVRILEAEGSLKEMLKVDTLDGKKFLDIGSGSGLFSLAARRLGAQVYSFDYDPQSVFCTQKLKELYFPGDIMWTVEQGNALATKYLLSLGKFDIVCSWGVLHHTGSMWEALDNACLPTKEGGKVFIAIYNDQGWASKWWLATKKAYNSLPGLFKYLVLLPAFIRLWGPTTIKDFLRARPFSTWIKYKRNRGMSAWRDVVDWVGGYPFEVARPEEIFDFFISKGFTLIKLKTCAGGHGCNEFVFKNKASREEP